MAIMKEAMNKEDWDRVQKGLKPRAKRKVEMPKYDLPEVKGRIELKHVPIGEVVGFFSSPKPIRNAEGVRFIGHEVTINIRDKKPINGWMQEGDVIRLRQLTGKG